MACYATRLPLHPANPCAMASSTFKPVSRSPISFVSASCASIRQMTLHFRIPGLISLANPCAMASSAFTPVSWSPIPFVSASSASVGKRLHFRSYGYIPMAFMIEGRASFEDFTVDATLFNG